MTSKNRREEGTICLSNLKLMCPVLAIPVKKQPEVSKQKAAAQPKRLTIMTKERSATYGKNDICENVSEVSWFR